jgi:microcin C transport system substrate-binding protein
MVGKILLSFLASYLIFCCNLKAGEEGSHGIAMHGDLKYPENFQYFEYVNPNAPKGGKIKMPVVGTYNTLNPFVIKGTPPAGLSFYSERLVYEQLMARSADEPFSLYGMIAKRAKMAPDRSWIIFILDPKAKWADERPIVIEDVIFSYMLLKEKGPPNLRLYYSKVEKVEKLSNNSVKFTFKLQKDGTYDPEAPMLLALMTVLPKHALEGRDLEKLTMEPILGSGPYIIADFKPGHFIRYKRRSNYWGEHLPVMRGRFNFDEIVFEYYRNSKVELEAFKVGQFDVRSEQDPSAWRRDYDFPAVKAGKVIKVEYQHSRPVGMRGLVFNTRKEIFSDARVREALTYAFDFEWLNRTLFQDSYVRTESYFSNTILASHDLPQGEELKLLLPYKDKLSSEVFQQEFKLPQGGTQEKVRANLKKAIQLLQKAGWITEKGVLINQKTKKPFKFEILLYRPDDEKIALAFARNLKHLGIQVSIRCLDTAQFETRRSQYDYDMIIWLWGHTMSPGNEQKYYWGSQSADEPGGHNYAGIKSPIIDALCDNIANARDRAHLIPAIQALDRVLLWGYYAIPLYYSNKIYLAYWNKFSHPNINPDVGLYFSLWWSKGKT